MSKPTENTPEISAEPFFARFLEEQAEPTEPTEQPQPWWDVPSGFTAKYPSDWEDR